MTLVPGRRTGRSTASYLRAQKMRRQRQFAGGADVPISPTRIGLLPGDIDPAQPVNRGLVWCLGAHPAASPLLGRDLIGRQPVTLDATADLTSVHPDQALWRSLAINAAGDQASWASAKLRTITNQVTIAVHASVTAGAADAILLVISWIDDAWTTPFYTLGLRADGVVASTTDAAFQFTDGTTLFEAINSAGTAWNADSNDHWIVATRNGTTARIYFDGVKQGADLTVSGNAQGFNTSGSRLITLGRGPDAGQRLSDADYHSASIWQRELSAAEVAELAANSTVQFIGGS